MRTGIKNSGHYVVAQFWGYEWGKFTDEYEEDFYGAEENKQFQDVKIMFASRNLKSPKFPQCNCPIILDPWQCFNSMKT